MFLKIDKKKAERRGSIFLGSVLGKVIVGRVKGTSKTSALLSLVADNITGNTVPEIELLKFKKVRDTYKMEAMLHSLLYEYKGQGEYYHVTQEELNQIWKDACNGVS